MEVDRNRLDEVVHHGFAFVLIVVAVVTTTLLVAATVIAVTTSEDTVLSMEDLFE